MRRGGAGCTRNDCAGFQGYWRRYIGPANRAGAAKRAGSAVHRRRLTAVEFPPSSFEAVAAFYSITHVPRDKHAALLRRIAEWLTSRGRFLGSFGETELDDWTGEWLGTTMFFSHYDSDASKRLVANAGLVIERAEVLRQDDESTRFLWITACKQSCTTCGPVPLG
jgi:cyclopropane fatty-acyl-phospholipid synthase-like methyltransferase